jgi:leader peptidase (prepilin peptidase)/N-methyltransferase
VSLLYAEAALLGLVFGSFLNVCIARLPCHESIVSPRSHCRACGTRIRWYDNIPVLSYMLLGGRCRFCRERISLIYPLVEALTALGVVAAMAVYGPSLEFVKCTLLMMLLVIVIFTDLLERRIPHPVTIFGIAAGLGFSFVVPVDNRPLEWALLHTGVVLEGTVSSVVGAVAGGLFGAGLFYFVGWLFIHFLHKEALGFGDVMLMGLIGTFLGIPLTYLTILMGSLLGIITAVILAAANKRFRSGYHWPYGSFLGTAAIYASLFGQPLLDAYLRSFHGTP